MARGERRQDKCRWVVKTRERLVAHRAPHSRLDALAVREIGRIANAVGPRREASGIRVVEGQNCGFRFAATRHCDTAEIPTAQDHVRCTIPVAPESLRSTE